MGTISLLYTKREIYETKRCKQKRVRQESIA